MVVVFTVVGNPHAPLGRYILLQTTISSSVFLKSVYVLYMVLALLSIGNEASTFSVPSKIYAYLTIGKPILGLMPITNLASKKIKKMKAGYVFKPDNIKAFLDCSKKIIKNKKLRIGFSKNAKNYLKIKQLSIHQMIRIIEQLRLKGLN